MTLTSLAFTTMLIHTHSDRESRIIVWPRGMIAGCIETVTPNVEFWPRTRTPLNHHCNLYTRFGVAPVPRVRVYRTTSLRRTISQLRTSWSVAVSRQRCRRTFDGAGARNVPPMTSLHACHTKKVIEFITCRHEAGVLSAMAGRNINAVSSRVVAHAARGMCPAEFLPVCLGAYKS